MGPDRLPQFNQPHRRDGNILMCHGRCNYP